MRIKGKLLDVKPAGGSFKDREDPTRTVDWSNVTVRIFDGREVVVVKVKGDAQPHALELIGHEGKDVELDFDSPRDALPTYNLTVVEVSESVPSI